MCKFRYGAWLEVRGELSESDLRGPCGQAAGPRGGGGAASPVSFEGKLKDSDSMTAPRGRWSLFSRFFDRCRPGAQSRALRRRDPMIEKRSTRHVRNNRIRR